MKNFLTFAMLMGVSLAGFAQKADSTKTTKITLRGVPVGGTEPLVVIDGNKQYIRGASTLSELNQSNIESMSILKDSLAISKYGPEGFAGVIEVKTKNNPLARPSAIPATKQFNKAPLKGKAIGFSVRPQTTSAKDGNSNFSVSKNGIKIKNGKDTPLYIIDGEEAKGTENIDNNDIKDVTVLKDASGISQYGEKGKNGVIIITTKKAKASPKKN